MGLLNDFKGQIDQRLNNKYGSAFLISWGVWNFKTILTVFSDISYYEKMGIIQAIYGPISEGFALSGFAVGLLWPALSALVYVIFSPWLADGVLLYMKLQKAVVKKFHVSLDKLPLVTREEHDAEIQKLRERSSSESYRVLWRPFRLSQAATA